MSKVEKDWTFVDDDGFLLMNSISAHYSRRKDSSEQSTDSAKDVDNQDNNDSSGSETEFEVVSRKNTGDKKDEEEVEVIRLKEDHFGSLQIPLPDSQDDGSDIEVVREHGTPPVFVDHDVLAPTITYEVLDNFTTTTTQDGLVTVEALSDTSTLIPDDRENEVSFGNDEKEEGFIASQKQQCEPDVGSEVSSIQGFESLSQSWVEDFECCPDNDDSDLMLGVAQLFERALNECQEDREKQITCTEGNIDALQNKHSIPQNPKTVTLVFIVCLSVAFGLVLGRALVPSPNNVVQFPAAKQENSRDYNKPETKQDSTTEVTPPITKESTTPNPSEAWIRGLQSMRLRNIYAAYQDLRTRNSMMETEFRQLKSEYRLYRLHTMIMRRRKHSTQEKSTVVESRPQKTISEPIPPKALSKAMFSILRAPDQEDASGQFSIKPTAEEEIVELKREILRQKRKADIWRQRYLNAKMDKVSRCRINFGDNSHVLSFKQCIQKFSQYFNFTEFFQSQSKEEMRKNAGAYFNKIMKPVSKLRSKVSSGLHDVGKRFDNVWQTLKVRWQNTGKEGSEKNKRRSNCETGKPSGNRREDITDPVPDRPPRYKWARFRKMLHISNIVGTLKNVVSGKGWETRDTTENAKMSKSALFEQQKNCVKDGSVSKPFQEFKKRWTQQDDMKKVDVKEAERDKDEVPNDQSTSDQYTVMSAIPDNFEVSYPQPSFTEPQLNEREFKPMKTGEPDSDIAGLSTEPERDTGNRDTRRQMVLTKSERSSLAEILGKEAERELKQKFEHFREHVTKRGIKFTVADKVAPKSKDLMSSMFRVEMSNVERMFRRYSNRVREERRKFQERIRRLRLEISQEKKKLEKDKIKFNSWALQERLNIAKEYAKNAQEFKSKLQRLQEWKRALKEKVKKRKATIKAWLKEKLKKLLSEVEEAKGKAEREISMKSYSKNKEQLKKFKKILREERNKIKNVHKYYRYSIKKAKRKLDDEKKVYELAKVKAKELLATYENLLLKLRLEQREARNTPMKDSSDERKSKISLEYPSVFCPDQDSCTGQHNSVMKFTETPLVYCPHKDSCVGSEDISSENIASANQNKDDKEYKVNKDAKRGKRSFRKTAQFETYFNNMKTDTVEKQSKDFPPTRNKRKHTRRGKASTDSLTSKTSDVLMLKSVQQLLAKFNKELNSNDNSKFVLVYGRYDGKQSAAKKWEGPIEYQNGESVPIRAKKAVPVLWRGPLQYSPSTILLHDHKLQSIHFQKGNKNERQHVQVMVKGTTEVTSHHTENRAVRLLYKNGLPRFPITGNSSSDDSIPKTEIDTEAAGNGKNDVDKNERENLQNYAMPLSWYMTYAKGREELRDEEKRAAAESRWYFDMMNARQHARDEVDDSSDDWYMRMMEARRHYGDNTDILGENWFLKMMEERGRLRGGNFPSEASWYLRMMQGRQRQRDDGEEDDDNWKLRSKKQRKNKEYEGGDREFWSTGKSGGSERRNSDDENSCYLRPDQKKKMKKHKCWKKGDHKGGNNK